ncbi:FG-GAP repeat domain-containing protein [Nannocystis punicea]|uniref:VCBS repeat-containing protein n=1 Tax=Nannocystis punicea TaxID=2995304 RepID=A0ABY7HDR7_9BACT|nr:VCBS repeat-containing protein [Nannocystis poenicansa]WAS97424.1 VCBS repeat-containing protein [Nannocystis poenicansa]
MRRWFGLGVGVVVACGPTPPPESDTDGGSSSAATTGGGSMTGGGPTSPQPSTDPTITTAAPPTTGAVTTEIDPPTTGLETATEPPTTSNTSTTGTTGEECVDASGCPPGQVCIAGACVGVAEVPSCDVPSVVTTIVPLMHLPTSLVAADLDSDGDVDIAVGAPAISVIEVLFNTGVKDFVTSELIALVPATGDLQLAAGDLDVDGDTDLAIAQEVASDVNVLVGEAGLWTVKPKLDAQSGTRRVWFADVDINGSVGGDLVTIGESSPTIGTWIGDGFGNYQAGPSFDLPVSLAVSVVDASGDALSDLVGPTSLDGFTTVRVFSRIDGAGFEEQATLTAGGTVISQALAGELDNVVSREIVALTQDDVGGLVAVWRAPQPGQWEAAPLLARAPARFTGGLLADVNDDTLLDLVVVGEQATVSVMFGGGDGSFFCEHTFELLAPAPRELLAVGDVDGDGRLEIVAGAPDLKEIQVIATL